MSLRGNEVNPTNTCKSTNAQQGSVLLEALIALMIFSFGILGSIGVQAKIIGLSSDAGYRTDATFLANQIIAQIWVDPVIDPDDPTGMTLNVNSAYACAPCTVDSAKTRDWLAQMSTMLPGVPDSCQPSIAMNGNQVTVTVQWKLPQEAGNTCHAYSSTTEIQYN
ncbi:MAG: hypothetical protein A2063_09295 [Gallionellales bacterium GWA2_60_142]|nr:MAG: hypothetical protein A2063_09295 [Gallionellales bacterium GWA2_60_142]HCI13476.1 hypothetical protein [Gallionellaceae bacterium]